MIQNNQIQSGADIEILLGEKYIQQIIQTFFESESIPESMTAEGYTIEIPQPESVFLTDEDNRDLGITIPFKYIDPDGEEITIAGASANIYATFNFNTEFSNEGDINALKIQIQVSDFDGSLETIRGLANLVLDADKQITKEAVLDLLNQNIGQEYPLNIFGKGKRIRSFHTKKFADDHQAEKAIGLYLNLRLQQGPEPFNVFENRTVLDDAINFLPEGQAIAFGMNEDMYGRLSSDFKQGFAEEKTPGEGDWHYPLKERDKTKGKIRSIKIVPLKKHEIVNGNLTLVPANGLHITLKGEVFVEKVDIKPDFTVKIALKPEIKDGKITWESELLDTDIDLTFWEELKLSFMLGFIFTWIFAFFIGPAALLVGAAVTGISMLIVDPVADAIGEGMVGDMYKKYVDASLFDTIPDRVTTITKRQDPFYATDFQVVTNINHLLIDDDGFSIAGTATTGEEYEPVEHVVLKNELRTTDGTINGFEIRVKDFDKIEPKYADVVSRRNKAERPEWYSLSLPDIDQRRRENKFKQGVLFQIPWKIDKEENAIRRILVISELEKNEIENKHIGTHLRERSNFFEENHKAETEAEVVAAMEKDLGRPLADKDNDEKQRRYNEKKSAWLEEEKLAFKRGGLKPLYNADAEAAVSLDMSPDEFGRMQVHGLMAMIYTYRLIRIKKTDTFYYRTKANITEIDNLGNFPEYESPDSGA